MRKQMTGIGLCLLLLATNVLAAEHPDEDFYDPALPKTSGQSPAGTPGEVFVPAGAIDYSWSFP